MPVVLSQIFAPADRIYKDAEWSLYHYPRQYFSRITPYDQFIYYRPHGKRARREDSSHYFGYGVLGRPIDDPDDHNHRFVDLIKADVFPRLVPLRDPLGLYYETESDRPVQARSAVRTISDITYHRILAAAEVSSTAISLLPSTEDVASSIYLGPPIEAPIDGVRFIDEIPKGTGYVPRDGYRADIHESAALQERARADHQRVLRIIHTEARQRGARCWYNNHVDLVADFGDERTLIEAKSLNDVKDAVNRMRYGIGQLADYQFRYRAKLDGATPVLAFGRPPDRETSFVSSILEENGIAFVSCHGDRLLALNRSAEQLRLFS